MKSIVLSLGIMAAVSGALQAQLGRQQGLIDPNVAAEKELLALPHMTAPVVKSILAKRPFRNVVELNALLAYVRLLTPGYVLYDRHCAACHGDDGRGGGSLGDESCRPTVVFDGAYFRRRDPEQVRAAVWHMLATERPAMPHFRRVLTEREARAVILYLQSAD